MCIKIIATIFICFYSCLGFSQTKQSLQYFERHSEISPRFQGSCWGMGQYRYCKEDYAISLFSDSSFFISYSRTGNLYPELYQILEGNFFKNNDGIYLIRDSVISKFSKNPLAGGGLEQVLNIGIPLRVEYTDDAMSFYNSAGPFLFFKKTNPFIKYKNAKPVQVFTPIPAFSPQFSNNPISF
jgi:hypothetical protein